MQDYSFRKARIILTSWYVGILTIILLLFSFALYSQEQKDFARIIVQRDFGGRVPRIFTLQDRDEVEGQLDALRNSFIINLLLADGFILLVGGGLSFFLAGLTLRPIQQTFERQKTFLADVSHEIRTPLAAIQTATEVALRSKDKSKEVYRKVIAEVFDESKRLTKMANDLLLLSRIESNVLKPFSKINLSSIVRKTVEEFNLLAKKEKIHLVIQIEDDVFTRGNEYELTQLIVILLDNAIKYTKENGKISITLSKKQKTTLTVADTGVGIPAEKIEHIFDRFYQVDASRSGSGIGLGLSIAKRITEVHSAHIQVKSALGKGTTFAIVFPSFE